MSVKNIILIVSAMSALFFIALSKMKGTEIPIEIILVGGLGSVFVYLLVRDWQTDKALSLLEKRLSEQSLNLKKLDKTLHGGSLKAELIDNPEESSMWWGFEKEINVFNAPWSLAIEKNKLYPAFLRFLQQEESKLNILVFESQSPSKMASYEVVIERLRKLMKMLKIDGIKVKNKVIIKRVVEAEQPTTTFFLSTKNGVSSSILYLYPFLHETPQYSIVLNDDGACGAMKQEFLRYWNEKGDLVEIS